MNSGIFFQLILSFIIPSFLFFLLKRKRKCLDTRNIPLGPKTLPIIGNLHQIGVLPHRSLQKLSKIYGDLMFVRLGSVPTIVISSPDMARKIFKTHDLAFSGRPSMYIAKKFTHNFSSISLSPYGEYWRQVRKIVVLELMTVKRVLQSFGKIRAEEVARMVDSIAEHGRDPVNLSILTFSLSNNVVCRAAFGICSDLGKTIDGRTSKFHEMLLEMQRIGGKFNLADFFPRMEWVNKFNGIDKSLDTIFRDLDGFFDKVIEEHRDRNRHKPEVEDIIDVLLRVQMDPDRGITLKDEHIKGVLFDIFAAGTDTSPATIDWTMAELMRNPEIREKAQQEVRKACKGKLKVEEDDLQKLTYLKLIVKESLRLYPPVPLMLPRETTEDCVIDDKYKIPAKTRVIFNAKAIATDPKYWLNPEQFWPERFLNSETDFRGQNFEMLPFGCGRRSCPGINFSISLVELALANLLFLLDLELPHGMSAKDIDMEEASGIVVHKKNPLHIVASPAT
ncbi:strychnine-11-hydroxylase-like [Primulina tabacum]|uniref:strychnine-11-hydroxylase-like n=1 Tax=Primulina tabacum TaxID=48773 RepID=UPI003F597E1E